MAASLKLRHSRASIPHDALLAVCLRVLSEHLGIPRLSIDQARGWISRLAITAPTAEAQRLVADLEEQTGMRIADLANEALQWGPADESCRTAKPYRLRLP